MTIHIKEHGWWDTNHSEAHVFVMDESGKYQNRYPVTAEDPLTSEKIPGLVIQMEEIFPDILKEPVID